jgi:hypothetical protein
MPKFKSLRLGPCRVQLVGRDPQDYAQELQEAIKKLWEKVWGGIPAGFNGTVPPTIQAGVAGSAGNESAGWMAADAQVPIETGIPANPTGKVASEGTGTALMRASATIAQGIVTTKGDILSHDGATAERLGVGADALYLTAHDAQTTGLRWGPIVLTPSVFTSNQNDWAPSRKNVYRVASDASRNLTGLVAGTDGEVRRIVNKGTQNVVLKHDDAASSTANRFITPNAVDLTLEPGDMAEILYDLDTARWRTFRLEGGALAGADVWVEFWWPPTFTQAPA